MSLPKSQLFLGCALQCCNCFCLVLWLMKSCPKVITVEFTFLFADGISLLMWLHCMCIYSLLVIMKTFKTMLSNTLCTYFFKIKETHAPFYIFLLQVWACAYLCFCHWEFRYQKIQTCSNCGTLFFIAMEAFISCQSIYIFCFESSQRKTLFLFHTTIGNEIY